MNRKVVAVVGVGIAVVAGLVLFRSRPSPSLHFIGYTNTVQFSTAGTYARFVISNQGPAQFSLGKQYSETASGKKEDEGRGSFERLYPDPTVVPLSCLAPAERWRMHVDFCYRGRPWYAQALSDTWVERVFPSLFKERCVRLVSPWLEPPQ